MLGKYRIVLVSRILFHEKIILLATDIQHDFAS